MVELIVNLVGNGFSIFSWIPQIIKIMKTHDVEGFDIKAYIFSMIASAIFFLYSAYMHNWGFMFFPGISFLLASIETFLIFWYGVVNKMKVEDPTVAEVGEVIVKKMVKHHVAPKYILKVYRKRYLRKKGKHK